MIELHRSKDGQFYVRTDANNNKNLNTAETFTTKAMAKKNIISTAFVWGKIFGIVDVRGWLLNNKIPVTDYTGKKPKVIYL